MCETDLAELSQVLHNGRVMTRSNGALACVWSIALGAAACACSSGGDDGAAGVSGGQTGSESYGCLPVSAEPLEPEAMSAIGVSARDVLARIAAYEQGELRYAASGERVGYTLELEPAEAARFEQREWRSDGSGIERATACEDALVVPVSIAFDTDDGAFAERWTSFVTSSASGFTSLSHRARADELGGSYEPSPSETANASRVSVLFNLTLLGPSFVGTLSAQIEERSGDVVGAREIPIATFPASTQ